MNTMNFVIEKVSNMIFISCKDHIFKSWEESKFTERKLANAKKKIAACYGGPVTFSRTF